MLCWGAKAEDVLIILHFREVFVTDHFQKKTSGLSQYATIRGNADHLYVICVWYEAGMYESWYPKC